MCNNNNNNNTFSCKIAHTSNYFIKIIACFSVLFVIQELYHKLNEEIGKKPQLLGYGCISRLVIYIYIYIYRERERERD
jgi:hypothetical protein